MKAGLRARYVEPNVTAPILARLSFVHHHIMSLISRLRFSGAIVEVPMGATQFVAFQHQIIAIGTSELGSCSVVVIASEYGAILAHIPPRPPYPSNDRFAGDDNVRYMMARVAQLFHQYGNFFPQPESVVVCAWYDGAVALPDQLDIMTSSLRQIGLRSVIRTYHVPAGSFQGQGTVVAIRDGNQRRVQIYVEDRPL